MPLVSKHLQSYYQGRVLANETAMDNPVVVNTLDSLARRDFKFYTTTGMKSWNISDRH